MSNFHSLEMDIIRHAEANGLLEQPPGLLARELDETLFELRDAIAAVDSVTISDAMGRSVIDLIILCAMLDIDLSKCLEQAFEKISAEPEAPSNVVFLKKE